MTEPKIAIALYSYEPQEEGELLLLEGDILTVLEEDASGWWSGESNGKTGLFPGSYVEYVDEQLIESLGLEQFEEISEEPNNTTEQDLTQKGGGEYSGQNINDENYISDEDNENDKETVNQNQQEITQTQNFTRNLGGTTMIHDGYIWEEKEPVFKVTIGKTVKRKKLRGMKKYTAYLIHSGNFCVTRRYKHFLWLRQRLVERYENVPVPPMPEKQFQGRFGEDFISRRREGLNRFLNRICEHPILRSSQIFHHFLEADEYQDWKMGKRAAEKQNKKEVPFFKSITCAQEVTKDCDNEITEFKKNITSLDKCLKNVQNIATDLYLSNYQDLSASYLKFSKAFLKLGSEAKGIAWRENCYPCKFLKNAIIKVGKNLGVEGKELKERGMEQRKIFIDPLKDYNRLIQVFVETIKVRDQANFQYVSTHAKYTKQNMGELSGQNRDKLLLKQDKSDRMTNITLAEIELFHYNRLKDSKQILTNHLKTQIEYFRKSSERWKKVKEEVEKIPVIHGSKKLEGMEDLSEPELFEEKIESEPEENEKNEENQNSNEIERESQREEDFDDDDSDDDDDDDGEEDDDDDDETEEITESEKEKEEKENNDKEKDEKENNDDFEKI
ncbi:sorting nexin [Anaeramoeba flamelloides]|uniref:Sorting nexin n=1 Tax=Anaeramoeba flamelloides TaxID=1746091 RepID=A0AAV7YBZ7_9EUKA|nr:sorting nexin [Anaeramoeba flamelloides]